MGSILYDIRSSVRQFRKAPGFTITVRLTVALGVGANTAIFTLIDAVLLKHIRSPIRNSFIASAMALRGTELAPIRAAISWPVLGLRLLVSVVTGIFFGVEPAWAVSRSNPADAMANMVSQLIWFLIPIPPPGLRILIS